MCDICGGRGIVLINNDTARPCECLKALAVKNKLKNAGIPGKPVKLKDFDLRYYSETSKIPETQKSYYQAAKDALNAARRFVNKQDDGLALVGPAGRGKTFLARCAAHELLAKGKPLIFIDVPGLLSEIKDTYQPGSSRSELDILEAARTIDILFLDDLGAHNYTPWVENQLYIIFNYRMNNKLPTFITTNLTTDEMAKNLGTRIVSRIIGLCEIHYIHSEVDIRLMNRRKKLRGESA